MTERPTLPVPWVACWSDEAPDPGDHLLSIVSGHLRYREERPADRDSLGVLWTRVALAPGKGKPQFGQVHSHRQRSCMTTPRCQVCGKRFVGPTTFLLHDDMLQRMPERGYWITATPPVHRACADLALQLCPHLRSSSELLWMTVTNVGMFGWLGDLAQDDGTWAKGRYVAVTDEQQRSKLLAKQLVVAVTEWTEEPYA